MIGLRVTHRSIVLGKTRHQRNGADARVCGIFLAMACWVSWHDAFPGNILYEFNPERKRSGEYRKDDVEIISKNPGQLSVGFVLKGEWLAYTMEVPETGA